MCSRSAAACQASSSSGSVVRVHSCRPSRGAWARLSQTTKGPERSPVRLIGARGAPPRSSARPSGQLPAAHPESASRSRSRDRTSPLTAGTPRARRRRALCGGPRDALGRTHPDRGHLNPRRPAPCDRIPRVDLRSLDRGDRLLDPRPFAGQQLTCALGLHEDRLTLCRYPHGKSATPHTVAVPSAAGARDLARSPQWTQSAKRCRPPGSAVGQHEPRRPGENSQTLVTQKAWKRRTS